MTEYVMHPRGHVHSLRAWPLQCSRARRAHIRCRSKWVDDDLSSLCPSLRIPSPLVTPTSSSVAVTMRVSTSFQLALQLAVAFQVAQAIRLPFRRDFRAEARSASALLARANDGDPYNFNVVDFDGDNQIIYVANITVDGASYEVSVGQIHSSLGSLQYESTGSARYGQLGSVFRYAERVVHQRE